MSKPSSISAVFLVICCPFPFLALFGYVNKIALFLVFFKFFCLFLSSACRACFCPVLACRGLGLSRALLPLYMFALATLGRLSPCRGFPAVLLVGLVGYVGLFVCVIAWLSSSPSVAGCRPVWVYVLQAVAVCAYPCQGVRLSNKCFEQDS